MTAFKPAMDFNRSVAIQKSLDKWFEYTTYANALAQGEARRPDNLGAEQNLSRWKEVMGKAYRQGEALEMFFEYNYPEVTRATLSQLKWKTITLDDLFEIPATDQYGNSRATLVAMSQTSDR